MMEAARRTSALVLAAGLLVWGATTGHLVPALAMAVIAAYPRLSRHHWEIDDRELCRIADLSSVLFGLVTVLQFMEFSLHGIYRILGLIPYCLYPLVVSQQFSATGTLPLSALFLGLRREVRAGRQRDRRVDVAPYYVLACLLSASSGQTPGYWFFGSAAVVVIGLLAPARPARHGLASWAVAVAAALMIALALQDGIRVAQQQVEAAFLHWLNQYAWLRPDPDHAMTAIGSIGRLKLSDRIQVRVRPSKSVRTPLLLHEASYVDFHFGTWSVTDSPYEAVDATPGNKAWRWLDASRPDGHLDLTIEHRHDLSLLPLPAGTVRIVADDIVEVQRNRYATTLVEAKPGHLRYRAEFQRDRDLMPPPRADDLVIPVAYRGLIDGLRSELGLDGLEPRRALAVIRAYFARDFTYSLVQKGFYPGRTPLAQFLLQDHHGHCEYFATSTVLLLRAAGIPARYAVGYVVQEFSELENAYIARARHAHSWALAFVNGRWLTVDTTPGTWYDLEQEAASGWQSLQDAWSWLAFHYRSLRSGDHGALREWLAWLILPLLAVLVWRLRRTVRRAPPLDAVTSCEPAPGADSELFALVALLAAQGRSPAPGDTLARFLRHAAPRTSGGVELPALLALHYRHRFRPGGLAGGERAQLRAQVRRYLDGLRTPAATAS